MKDTLQENIRAACARAKALRSKDSLVFPVFTDLHTDGGGSSVRQSPDRCASLT